MLNIQKTTNYDQFKLFHSNRQILPQRLIQSIKKKNLLESHPILVSKDFRIIDGQHRWEAARQLKVPLYYIIEDGLEESDIPICQVQRPWSLDDFLDFFANKKEDYKFVQKSAKEFKLTPHFIIEIAYPDPKKAYAAFRSGDFYIKKDKENLKSKFVLFCQIREFCEGVQKSKFHKSSSMAIWRLINRPDYVHDHFMEKLDMYREQFINAFKFQSTRNVYETLISDVYNRNVKDKKKTLMIEPTKIKLRRINKKISYYEEVL